MPPPKKNFGLVRGSVCGSVRIDPCHEYQLPLWSLAWQLTCTVMSTEQSVGTNQISFEFEVLTVVQGAAYNNNRSTPQPRARKRHGKSLFLFSPALEGAIILLKNAAKYLPMSGSKVISVSPPEQGGKTLFFKNKGFWGFCAELYCSLNS